MGLYNILRRSDVVLNGKGQPVGGGSVFLYEPGGTVTQITAYKDSGLQTAHTQPIRLSGTGRANIWVTRDCDMYIYDRNNNLVAQELNANPAALSADELGGLINNGSFEVDTDANDEPDFWDRVDEAGSSNGIDTTTSTDGGQSFKFTSSGTGGGSLTTSEFFPVNDSDQLKVNFDLKASVANVRNIVRVQWYDVTQTSISNSDIYDSTANPTSWTSQNLSVVPPSGARFAKLAIIGCEATGASGTTHFDRVQVFYPSVVLGVFDNITIQDNEIITTNTNGSLAITPNGDGSVDIGNTNNPDLADTANSVNIGTDDPDNNAHLALGPSILQAKTDGTTTARLDVQPLGGTVRLGAQSGTGDVELYDDTDRVARTSQEGLDLIGSGSGEPSVPSNANTLLRLFNAGASNAHGALGFDGGQDLEITNFVHGGQVVLQGEDVSGAAQVMVLADPDGAVSLTFAGTSKLATTAAGVDIAGTLNATTALQEGGTSLESKYARLGASNAFTAQQEIQSASVWLNLQETDAGTDEKNWLFYGQGGQFRLETWNDAKNATAGIVYINRTGTTIDSVNFFPPILAGSPTGGAQGAGTINAEEVYVNGVAVSTGSEILKAVKTSDTSRSSTATRTDDPHLSISGLDSEKRYRVEVYLNITYGSSTNGGIRVDLNSDTLDDQSYLALYHDVGGGFQSGILGSASDIQFSGSGAAASLYIVGEFNPDGDDTTLTLQWAQSTSDTDATTLEDGSWMTLTPMN